MALYFFDSSALVKRYVHEQGSVWVRETTASVSSHLIHISTDRRRDFQRAGQETS
jgi:predicted nucleic acid-binding protein